jgi:hypothetical protein
MLNVAADDDLDEDGQGVNDIQNQPQGNAQKPPVNQPQRRAAPAKTQQEDKPADGAAATTGEIAYITKKIAAKGITVEEAQQMAGIEVTNTLNGLTKDGFVALKDALA